jgi:hypothetical protein
VLSEVGDILESLPDSLWLTYLPLCYKARLTISNPMYSIACLPGFESLPQLRAASALNQTLADSSKPAPR